LLACCAASVAGLSCSQGVKGAVHREYVIAAVEGDGAAAVLDRLTGKLVATIDLSTTSGSEVTRFGVHNVQGSNNGKTAWLTAVPVHGGAHSHAAPAKDQLVGIDLETLAVSTRIDLGSELHPAHVVMSGTTAYVTATDGNSILVVDLAGGKVERTIPMPADTKPHGLRMTRDGKTLVVAGMGRGSVELVDVATGSSRSIALPGRGVQAAVSPVADVGFVSVYDTKQIAHVDLQTAELKLFTLPAGSAGPVQIYPTPDGKGLWVADQGMLGADPTGTKVMLIDTASGAVQQSVTVAPGPHGIVVSPDGKTVWTTTLVNGTVDSIDAATGTVVSSVAVGKQPNGVTCVHSTSAMP
jgi:YVTN family beta-propeller protein